MPLVKAKLARELENILPGEYYSSPEAAERWARAYVSFAGTAVSSAGSLPANAQGNMGIVVGAFTGAFNSLSSAGAASAIASGILSFWQAIVWVGPTASGATIWPGNCSLSATLQMIFEDRRGKSVGDKAGELADAFEAGAKIVMVSDIPYVQPAPPIVGPIS